MSNGGETLFNWLEEHDGIILEFSPTEDEYADYGDILITMDHCGCCKFRCVEFTNVHDKLIDLLDDMYLEICEEVGNEKSSNIRRHKA